MQRLSSLVGEAAALNAQLECEEGAGITLSPSTAADTYAQILRLARGLHKASRELQSAAYHRRLVNRYLDLDRPFVCNG